MNSVDISNLTGSTLIVPSVSIGNVPQLAADLLIHNLEFDRVGTLDAKYLYPFISPIDYTTNPEKGYSTGLEVYFSEKNNLTLIQQRSPILPGFTKKFVEEVIAPFIENGSFKDILFLDSGDCGLQETVAVSGIQEYTNEDILGRSLESLNIAGPISLNETPYTQSKYTSTLVEKLSGVSMNIILIYVYEGENFYEATILANKVVEKLGVEVPSWVKPVSWRGVYGDKEVPNAMEDGLYG